MTDRELYDFGDRKDCLQRCSGNVVICRTEVRLACWEESSACPFCAAQERRQTIACSPADDVIHSPPVQQLPPRGSARPRSRQRARLDSRKTFWIVTMGLSGALCGGCVLLLSRGLYGSGIIGVLLALLHLACGLGATAAFNRRFGTPPRVYKAILAVLCGPAAMAGVLAALLLLFSGLTACACIAAAVGCIILVFGVWFWMLRKLFSLFTG